MKTKTSLILSALAMAFAAPQAFAQSSNFAGISASVGVSMVGANTKASDDGMAGHDNLGQNSQVGILDVGYGLSLSKDWVLGLGGSFDLGKPKLFSGADNGGTYSGKLKNHYSLYAQPTYLVNSTTGLYAKVGYHNAKAVFSNSGEPDTTRKVRGTGVGVGVKTFVDKNVFVQVEGLITNYKSVNFEDGFAAKLKTTSANVSLGYRF